MNVAEAGVTCGPTVMQSIGACTLFVPSALHAQMNSPNPIAASKTLMAISR